jgi:hypothetical protein
MNMATNDTSFSTGDKFAAVGEGIGAIGSLVGGNISAGGYTAEASEYGQAATLEQANEAYSQESTQLQTIATQRRATKIIGAGEAAVGASGFQESGSSLSLLRDSTAQSHLAVGQIGLQGVLASASYQEQGLSYQAQAAGAEAAAKAASTGGVLGALTGIAKIGATLAGPLGKLF